MLKRNSLERLVQLERVGLVVNLHEERISRLATPAEGFELRG